MSGPKIGELFAGYGGLGMGVQAVYGGEVVWVSEFDKGPSKILEYRFPGVPNHGDITKIDWSQVEPVDILTGGSPCQDLSHAGRRAGMTEGTRSNLWVAMREAIAQLRPSVVVWENVRGAYSAEAASSLVDDARLLADTRRRDGEPVLRALGRVLGDLSDLGYDTSWHGLRAADVGAPHGRFRVFVVATDARDGAGHGQWSREESRQGGASTADADGGLDLPSRPWADQRPVPHGDGGGASAALLPTPRCADGMHANLRPHATDTSRLEDAVAVNLMPTPRATDGTKGGPNQRGSSGDLMLPSAVALLPTPAVNDMGEGKTVERWDEWTADMQAKHGNGNGHGKSLAIEAQRLLPTPRASDGPDASSHGRSWSTTDNNLHTVVKRGEIGYASAPEGGPGEELRDLRDADDPQEIPERSIGGSDGIPQAEVLLPLVREHADGGSEGHAALAGAETQGVDLSGLRDDEPAARSPRGPEPCEQRPLELDDALRELSPEAALAGGPGRVDWGPYEAAIRRWEGVLGRPAPAPTQLSTKGNPQLSPAFVEFLMGLPEGWVTDVPDITRNEALKALGNGVVPQQAAAALRVMAAWEVAA